MKNIESDELRDHCHLTSEYRRPAHRKCTVSVKQSQCKIIPIAFLNFSNYDCHLVFKELVDIKNDRVKLKSLPKTNEENIPIKCGCFKFIDIYRFF